MLLIFTHVTHGYAGLRQLYAGLRMLRRHCARLTQWLLRIDYAVITHKLHYEYAGITHLLRNEYAMSTQWVPNVYAMITTVYAILHNPTHVTHDYSDLRMLRN